MYNLMSKELQDGCTHRSVVNSLMSGERSIMCGVPHELGVGTNPICIFLSDMDCGIECTHFQHWVELSESKSANNTKLCIQYSAYWRGRMPIRGNLTGSRGSTPMWTSRSPVCKGIWVRAILIHEYRLEDEWIKSSPVEKGLEVLVEQKLDMKQHCALAARKSELHQKKHY